MHGLRRNLNGIRKHGKKNLLEWEHSFDSVIAPTVFDKNWWVCRILMTEELTHALDFPFARTAVMIDLDIERLTKVEVLGKVLVADQSC